MKLDSEPAASPAEYAFWQEADGTARVEYSLHAFHEIDFQVNEGYRRIPHGGVETGGILWGRHTQDGVTVEAFRQISCEHASGPSFLLSDRDLDGIREQLQRAELDEELRHLEPVGWFVAHTRSQLTLADRELVVFDKFFPGARKITLLVKPERFQPTRFGFLVRHEDGSVPREVGAQAFILPLPGRAGKGVLNSIPAPAAKPVSVPAVSVPHKKDADQFPQQKENFQPESSGPIEKEPKVSLPPPPVAPVIPVAVSNPQPAAEAAVVETTLKPEQAHGIVQEAAVPVSPVVAARGRGPSAATRLFVLLLFAAALGCGVGYFAYLQLPPPEISLEAQKRSSNLLVQWPADQTRGVPYVAIRVDDGPPQLLTDQQKQAGKFEVPAHSDNTKIEIIAQHWIRDSRGIVRYLNAPQLSPQSPVERLDAQPEPAKPHAASESPL